MVEFGIGFTLIAILCCFLMILMSNGRRRWSLVAIICLTLNIIAVHYHSLGWPTYRSASYLEGATIHSVTQARYALVTPRNSSRPRLVEVPFSENLLEAMQKAKGKGVIVEKMENKKKNDTPDPFDGYEFELEVEEGKG